METDKTTRETEVYGGKRFTRLDAVVGLTYGLCLSASGRLARECEKYQRKIYFRNEKGIISNSRSIIDIICLGASKNAKLQILVEGEDKEAGEIALRLARGISAESHSPEF